MSRWLAGGAQSSTVQLLIRGECSINCRIRNIGRRASSRDLVIRPYVRKRNTAINRCWSSINHQKPAAHWPLQSYEIYRRQTDTWRGATTSLIGQRNFHLWWLYLTGVLYFVAGKQSVVSTLWRPTHIQLTIWRRSNLDLEIRLGMTI